MATVADILAHKGSDVVSLPPDATVLAAAHLMNERGIGGLLVMDDGRLEGIFTERDILRRIVAVRRDPASTTIAEVATSPVVTARPTMPLEECAALLTQRRLRHLPIMDDNGLYGIVTIGDVLAYRVSEQEDRIQYMEQYIYDVR